MPSTSGGTCGSTRWKHAAQARGLAHAAMRAQQLLAELQRQGVQMRLDDAAAPLDHAPEEVAPPCRAGRWHRAGVSSASRLASSQRRSPARR